MGLLDEARQHHRQKGQPCTMGSFLASLSDTERAEVVDALTDRSVPSTALRDALVDRGHQPPAAQTMQRHRRGECRCG